MVGDSLRADIEGALAAGTARGVAAARRRRAGERPAAVPVIRRLHELPSIIWPEPVEPEVRRTWPASTACGLHSSPMSELRFRDLHTADEFRQVMALEQEVWGFTDLNDMVTVPVFTITTKRGAILDRRLRRQPTGWSASSTRSSA